MRTTFSSRRRSRWAWLAVWVLPVLAGCNAPAPELSPEVLYMYHNNLGPMCLEMKAWLNETVIPSYPNLIIEEHLLSDLNALGTLNALTAQYDQSQGPSSSFQYMPAVFYQGHAYSGFDESVKSELSSLIEQAQTSSD